MYRAAPPNACSSIDAQVLQHATSTSLTDLVSPHTQLTQRGPSPEPSDVWKVPIDAMKMAKRLTARPQTPAREAAIETPIVRPVARRLESSFRPSESEGHGALAV